MSTEALVVHLRSIVQLDDEQLYALARANPDLRFERSSSGDLLIMSPTGGETGRRNAEINRRLGNWAHRDGSGLTFDSSTGFVLADGAVRSADSAWVRRDRWEALTRHQRERFPPLCPDFVIELLSESDSLSAAQEKMGKWLASGALLGWLIEPREQTVWVYRPGCAVEQIDRPGRVQGDPELPGFVLELDCL